MDRHKLLAALLTTLLVSVGTPGTVAVTLTDATRRGD
jgi:hypothetical protein